MPDLNNEFNTKYYLLEIFQMGNIVWWILIVVFIL